MTLSLCNGDATKLEEVFEMNHRTILNILLMKKDEANLQTHVSEMLRILK